MCFYRKGLHFQCQGCGSCCTGFSGFVWLKKNEIAKIADYLKLEEKIFLENYTFPVFGRISLKEIVPSYSCIFFDEPEKKCRIYPVRPFQCQSFPFWPGNLASLDDWHKLKSMCPGIDQGKLYSEKEISELSQNYSQDLA
ncbi:MAG: YkgJ family cysteine cluster protein [Parachlamydiales bacterium]|jgi:hypothetical protein